MSKTKSKRKIMTIVAGTIIVVLVWYALVIAQQNNWFYVFGRNCEDIYMYGDTPMDQNLLFNMGNPCDDN